jgi:hypothetical protein
MPQPPAKRLSFVSMPLQLDSFGVLLPPQRKWQRPEVSRWRRLEAGAYKHRIISWVPPRGIRAQSRHAPGNCISWPLRIGPKHRGTIHRRKLAAIEITAQSQFCLTKCDPPIPVLSRARCSASSFIKAAPRPRPQGTEAPKAPEKRGAGGWHVLRYLQRVLYAR